MPTSKRTTPEEEVRARAHEIWLQQGRPDGHDLAHWQQAEAELAGKKPRAAPPQRAAAKPAAAKPPAKSAAAKPAAAKPTARKGSKGAAR